MAQVFKYNKAGQDQFSQGEFEPFFKIDKEKKFVLDAKKDGDYKIRILPPWSELGAFAMGTIVHYKVGLEKKHIICPNTVGNNICPFCQVHAKIKGDEMFAADDKEIRPVYRYLSNIVDLKNPGKGVLIFEYGPQIYYPIKIIQDKGEFGDLFDALEGRDINITRQVRGKVTDTVMPSGKMTPIQNPDYLDDLFPLHTLIPDVDTKLVEKLFNSHPWKVYETGNVSKPKAEEVDDNVGNHKELSGETSKPQEQDQKEEIKDLAAAIKAKLAKKAAAAQV